MESEFDKVFNESIEQYNEAKRVVGKETTVSKGSQKFGDARFSSKISTQTFGQDGEDGTNVYHDFSFTVPKKDIPLRMNWVRELKATDTKKAMSMIKKEIADLQSKAVRPLTKSLEVIEKRIKDLEDARNAIGEEHMKVYDLEKKSK